LQSSNCLALIAAYNEATIIEEVVNDLIDSGFQVLVIDDGSTDSTFVEASEAGAKVIRHLINRGQGAALNTGFRYIERYLGEVEYIVTFDADGQHKALDARRMVDYLSMSNDSVVLGTRFGKSNQTNLPILKKFVLIVSTILFRLLTKMKVTDLHNGLRALNRKNLSLFQLEESGYAHADEFLRIIRQNKLSFSEIEVTIHYTEYSKSKGQPLSNGFVFLFDKVWK
jgi:glycosyltransferase involved in cell wall biosynthesis